MRNIYFFIIFLIIGIVIKIWSIQNLPFDSDQAIVGLMGKHILEGAFPWLYYGDSYSGILEPLLVAWSFFFLGVNRLSLHLIPFIFSILFIISIYQLGREIFNREIALLALLLGAVPIFSMGYYSSLAYGGYIEILWLGNLILLITHRLARKEGIPSLLSLFFLGLLWGISWWTYPISVVYLFSSFCFLLFFKKELVWKGKGLAAVVSFFLGSLPFWIWNVSHRFPFWAFSRPGKNPDFFLRLKNFCFRFIEFFNASLKDEASFLAYLLVALFLVSLLFLVIGRKSPRGRFQYIRGTPFLLLFFFLTFCFFYIGSRFSEQNTLRYFLPLYSILPLTLAFLCLALRMVSRYVFGCLIIMVLLLNLYHQSSLIQFLKNHSLLYRKQLQVEYSFFSFLNQKKIAYAYAPEYWSAAELTFNAREHPVFTRLFKDRYPLYTSLADASSNPTFLLEGKYNQSFEEMFKALGGTYKKEVFSLYQKVKGYVIYYDFKPPAFAGLEIPPDHWKGTSNISSDSADYVFDRNISTGLISSSPQKLGKFYQLDLGRIYSINRVIYQSARGQEWAFPSFYRIELSKNGHDWLEVTSVHNNWSYLFWSAGRPFWKLRDGRIEINFFPQNARHIRITLTDSSPQPWSIGEVFVYQAIPLTVSSPTSLEDLVSFLSKEKIEYLYADIGLSAQITRRTRGGIKCLQDDYDITRGLDYSMWGYNGAFPYFNKLKRQVDFSLSSAFVVTKENNLSFVRTMNKFNATYLVKDFGGQKVYYGLRFQDLSNRVKSEKDCRTFYWNGTHLLIIN